MILTEFNTEHVYRNQTSNYELCENWYSETFNSIWAFSEYLSILSTLVG